jgi:hypothetical protein
MKKLLFLLMVLMFIVLTTENSSAQSHKTENCFTYDFYGYLPCTDELSDGKGEVCLTAWKGKVQIKQSGTFIGAESGKVYTLSFVGNQIQINWLPGQTFVVNITGTASLKCEGALFAKYKVIGHITVNDIGEIVVSRYELTDWVCK